MLQLDARTCCGLALRVGHHHVPKAGPTMFENLHRTFGQHPLATGIEGHHTGTKMQERHDREDGREQIMQEGVRTRERFQQTTVIASLGT
jgi:hypothetical protein